MSKSYYQLIWMISIITIILLITIGTILPPLISSNQFPAWIIVILCVALLGSLASTIILLIERLK